MESSSVGLPRFLWGAWAVLPGSKQTVPRAELFAMLLVVRHVVAGDVTIKSDSLVNCELFGKGKSACLLSVNHDLWAQLWSLIEQKALSVNMFWIKGHATVENILQHDLAPVDVAGNFCADALANSASVVAEVWPHDVANITWYYAIVRRVQARAVAVLSSTVSTRKLTVKCQVPTVARSLPEPSNVGAAILSQHKLCRVGADWHCNLCIQSMNERSPLFREWLASPCDPDSSLVRTLQAGNSRPTRLSASSAIVIGRQPVHGSHELHVYRGLYFCRLCGYHAHAAARRLAAACLGRTAPGAARRARTLLSGKLPSGLAAWPNG